ncbi:MAG TPA: thiamine pyrophosphate-dependent enzyme, partial [Polyangiaceae bacterium]|nr:thiamine pyrophosphate-dependent enzyme [Polyangiaceae bacterium]
FATMNFSPRFAPRHQLLHVDHDAAVLGRNYDCLPVHGDAQQVCRALLEGLAGEGKAPTPAWLAALQAAEPRVFEPAHARSSARPIRPERLMHELEHALPADACVVADIGTSCLFVAHCLRFTPPQRCYLPMAWSCMGHPLGAALGVRLGSGKPTVCVAGDAAFLAKGMELHAAVELGVDRFVCVVLSNRGHGLVRAGTAALITSERRVEDGTFSVQPDIAALGRAVGAEGVRVSDPNELRAAITHGLGCGRPCVIEVVVDPHAMPPMADRLQGLAKSGAAS